MYIVFIFCSYDFEIGNYFHVLVFKIFSFKMLFWSVDCAYCGIFILKLHNYVFFTEWFRNSIGLAAQLRGMQI